MQFLGLLLPLLLFVNAAWLVLYFRERALIRRVRERHPALLEGMRGRPRRWYDPSEELWLLQPQPRREFLLRVGDLGDAELAPLLARVRQAEAGVPRATAAGVVLSAALVAYVALVS